MKLDLKDNKKHRNIALVVGAVLLVIALFIIASISYAYAYSDRFMPGVRVANVAVGTMSYDEARELVNTMAGNMLDEGLSVSVNGATKTIPLRLISPDDPDLARDLVAVDLETVIDEAYSFGHRGHAAQRLWEMLVAGIAKKNFEPGVEIDSEAIEAQLLDKFEEYYDPAVEPSFVLLKTDDGFTVEVEDGSAGRAFDLDTAVETLSRMSATLGTRTLQIEVVDQEPQVTIEEAEGLVETVIEAVERAPYTLVYAPSRFDTHEFTIDNELIDISIAVERVDDEARLTLDENADELFELMVEEVDVEPQDARFSIASDRRVQEFKPSVDGRAVDVDATRMLVSDVLMDAELDTEIEIVVEITEPEVPTGSVNDLGITEILGVGTSDYSRSPSNRMHNIANATSRLNGLLIPPGEEFSLIQTLNPITQANGYLPEMVIKGDEIKPEVGGGLCQIGTTTFRAAMNSGLEITERRNHSLVVSYYNDPSNGNPGTDATVYGPHPDLRFMNDTESYILFMAYNDVPNRALTYTFWGTNDGRKGYYSPPVVHNWIPAGEKRTTYTTDYEPGYKKCQGAHSGANTSFTYYIERADGTVDEQLFESYYRPLPTICIEGVAEWQIDDDGNYLEDAVEPTEEGPELDDAEPEDTESDPTETPEE